MNLVLMDFQSEAVESLYQQVADARKRAAKGKLEAITLSAPTGSSETVILTRLIELILEGDEEHQPDAEAVSLWVTDQPELNIQTRDKMRATSQVLSPATTVEISADFDQETFPAVKVFFLNTQNSAQDRLGSKPGISGHSHCGIRSGTTSTRNPGSFCDH
jgi:type III restriction enzyme